MPDFQTYGEPCGLDDVALHARLYEIGPQPDKGMGEPE